ncbi:MAG TPA: succinate dehydrogenase [Burkholderiales bacterium]|jgi:fumarate reductase subunit C|nr:succinate dehydrogenase [Burkholderiales bacterium]
MNAKVQTVLWVMQRASATVLGLCVLVHLATLIYAVQGGLSAAEILGRTRGNVAWFAFYSIFVFAVTLHVPIGLRAVLSEWLGWRGPSRELVLLLFGVFLAYGGMRAVMAVFL